MTTPPRSFGWAVVGLGKHTRKYVAPAIMASTLGELVAVVSRDTERASRICAAWDQPAVYGDLAAALADPRVDGVWLSTPNQLHREQVEAAAAAGKHVLCEKPLAATPEDCGAMIDACEAAGVALGVGFHLRHNVVHERARDLVAGGAIGSVRFASVRYAHRTAPESPSEPPPASEGVDAIPSGPAAWRRDPALAGGGAFVGNGVHTIDLLRYLTGSELTTVSALADAPDRHESGLIATVELDNGALAFLQGGDLAYPVNDVVISGTTGTIHCVGSIGNLGEGSLVIETASGRDVFTPPSHNVYTRQADDFVARVRVGEMPDASGLDGLRCAEIVTSIYQAVADGSRRAVPTPQTARSRAERTAS